MFFKNNLGCETQTFYHLPGVSGPVGISLTREAHLVMGARVLIGVSSHKLGCWITGPMTELNAQLCSPPWKTGRYGLAQRSSCLIVWLVFLTWASPALGHLLA